MAQNRFIRKSMFDREKVGVPCPNCDRKLFESIGRLRRSPNLHCRFCGVDIDVQANELDRRVRQADKALTDFVKQINKTSRNIKISL